MGAKTSYDDPTNATDPPGGKHHDTTKESNDGPSQHKRDDGEDPKPARKSADADKVKRSVSDDKVSKAGK